MNEFLLYQLSMILVVFYCGYKIGRTMTHNKMNEFFHTEVEKEIKRFLENYKNDKK